MPFASVQTWIDLGLLLGVGLVVYVALLVFSTAARLVRPPRRTYAWAVARGLPGDPGELATPRAFTEWTARRAGRELRVWDVVGGTPGGPTVVISHGWGSSRIAALDRLDAVVLYAGRVLLWDLPGHGESGGWCTLGAGEGDDLLAVLCSAEPRTPLVLFGWSLGAEVTLDAATRACGHDVAGVVLEGAYRRGDTPARNVMRLAQHPWRVNLGPALALIGLVFRGDPRFRFRPLQTRRAERLAAPLLVLHGMLDTTSPPGDGRAIAEAGRGRFVPIEPAGHHDVWIEPAAREQAVSAVASWLGELGRGREPAGGQSSIDSPGASTRASTSSGLNTDTSSTSSGQVP